jgi:hypothetical protein
MKSFSLTLLLCLVLNFLGQANGTDSARRILTINNKPLDYNRFSLLSQGMLRVVSSGKNTPKVPFKIYLKRAGVVVASGASSDTREVYEIEVSRILDIARFGDQLIVESAQKGVDSEKTEIFLQKFLFDLLDLNRLLGKKDGC